jgi:hypothetical protein
VVLAADFLSETLAAGLSESVAAKAWQPGLSIRLAARTADMTVDSAVERKAAARTIGVTAFPDDESMS